MTKIAGSGSISQMHGSADPDPHQNVMDPEHWLKTLNLTVKMHEDNKNWKRHFYFKSKQKIAVLKSLPTLQVPYKISISARSADPNPNK
jgi:hypothetical protein